MYVLVCFRQIEDSHVKTNIVHTIFRVRKYGQMDLEKLKDVLSETDFLRCKRGQHKTWYTLPLSVFIVFIFQVSALVPACDHFDLKNCASLILSVLGSLSVIDSLSVLGPLVLKCNENSIGFV